MIELRWLNRQVEFHEGKGEFFTDSVLQYREKSRLGVYAMNKDGTEYRPTDIIHEWQDVPEVTE